MAFRIAYTYSSEAHLRALSASQSRRVLDSCKRHLRHQPTVPTRTRKQMRANPIAPWELRLGELRVYYDVEMEPVPTVYINAVGLKLGNRVFIGGEEVDLK